MWADRTMDRVHEHTQNSIWRGALNRPTHAGFARNPLCGEGALPSTTDQWSALTVDDWSRMEVAPTFKATYDAWNRLVKLTEPGTTTTDPVQENQYDGRGYRIVTKAYSNGTLSETRHAYFTDQWQITEERLGTSSTPDRQFVWGVRYIDDLILRDRSTTGTLNERLYALQDANWNVTTLTDSTGTIQERYEYDPYGVTTVLGPDFAIRATSNYVWETTYCGYHWDQASGLFAVRHRYYHPRLGVWLTRDPEQSDANLYEYAGSQALRAIDPFGLKWILDFGNQAQAICTETPVKGCMCRYDCRCPAGYGVFATALTTVRTCGHPPYIMCSKWKEVLATVVVVVVVVVLIFVAVWTFPWGLPALGPAAGVALAL